MSIIVTGATGGLGRATLEFLSTFSTPSTSIIGTTRDISRAPDIPGVTFREADFTKPETLEAAFAGASKVLIISSSSFDDELRLKQHKNAIDACVKAGVGHVLYTSLGICGSKEKTVSALQQAHLDSEELIKASGLPYTIIRETTYTEAFPVLFSWNTSTTSIIIPGDGPIPFATRIELAEGNARLLLSDSPEYLNATVLFTGPSTITLTQIVDLIKEVHDTPLDFEVLSGEEYVKRVVATGQRPEWFAKKWATTFKAFSDGETDEVNPTLEKLLGRKPRVASEVIKELLIDGKSSEEGGYTWPPKAGAKAAAK